MRRVVILGRGGAGKSVLARQLSELTGIPAIELDGLFWQPGPAPTPAEAWVARHRELVAGERWIIDGIRTRREARASLATLAAPSTAAWSS